MPDPLEGMQGEIKRPGLGERIGAAASHFVNPQQASLSAEAVGTTITEAMGGFAKQAAVFMGEEIAKFTADFTKGMETQMAALTDAIKKMSRETSEELGRNVEAISEKADRYSEQSIQKMLQRYQKMEDAAKASKQSLDELLPKIENDPNLKKIFAMMNFQVSDDPTTGKLMFQVGDKKVPLEEITTEQISQVARTGQLTAPPDYKGMVGRVQGGIQQVTGVVMPVMAPVEQMIQTIAPTGLEQFQMGMGLGSGAAQAAGTVGLGMSALGGISPALGAIGGVLGPIGMITGAAFSVATPLIEGYLKRRYESQERTYRFGAMAGGYGYGVEAEEVYAELGGRFFPHVSKEEMGGLIEGFARLGTATEKLTSQVAHGGEIMKNFNLSQQQVIQMAELQLYGGVGGMQALEANYSFLQAEQAATGGRSGAIFYENVQQSMFYSGFGAENDPDFHRCVAIVAAEVTKFGAPEADVNKFISFIFGSNFKYSIFGTMRFDTLSPNDILQRLRRWVLNQTGGRTTFQSQAWVDSKARMWGGIAPASVEAIAKWAAGVSSEQLEEEVTGKAGKQQRAEELNASLEYIGHGDVEGGRNQPLATGIGGEGWWNLKGGWSEAEDWYNRLSPEDHAFFANMTDEDFKLLTGDPEDKNTPKGRAALWRRVNAYQRSDVIKEKFGQGKSPVAWSDLSGEYREEYEKTRQAAIEEYGTASSGVRSEGGNVSLGEYYLEIGFKDNALSQLLEMVEKEAGKEGTNRGEGGAGKTFKMGTGYE